VQVIEGEIEVTIEEVTQTARPGFVAMVPAGARSVRVLRACRLIAVDYPNREPGQGSDEWDSASRRVSRVGRTKTARQPPPTIHHDRRPSAVIVRTPSQSDWRVA
jgi:hypothetical protein